MSPAPSILMLSMLSSSSCLLARLLPPFTFVGPELTVVRPPPSTTRSIFPEEMTIKSSNLVRRASILRSPRELLEIYNSVGSSWLNTGSSEERFDSRTESVATVSKRVCFHPSESPAGKTSKSSIKSCSCLNTPFLTGSISNKHVSTLFHLFTFKNGVHFLFLDEDVALLRLSARSFCFNFCCAISCCLWAYGILLLFLREKYPLLSVVLVRSVAACETAGKSVDARICCWKN
mmetsp:Transcript_21940/g.47643  ORF Transcript_21940/g.47643 Transcript_21940/m.47643 type:complete len:233 (+) Transcript_21940:1644-2342(+)